ncbi:hypothetical protein [Geomonas agri]|uniref:hypothetical protein n=1 Tax=Geomonas agri TaxID=2873702 RepID=UPI001CD37482|nr:hypothetical protein [Geomonas agri]
MNKATFMLSAALLWCSVVPAIGQTAQSDRDECLLASKNCITQVDDIYKRVNKLDAEIKKGNRVYTKDELKRLQTKLAETQDLLRSIELHGGK